MYGERAGHPWFVGVSNANVVRVSGVSSCTLRDLEIAHSLAARRETRVARRLWRHLGRAPGRARSAPAPPPPPASRRASARSAACSNEVCGSYVDGFPPLQALQERYAPLSLDQMNATNGSNVSSIHGADVSGSHGATFDLSGAELRDPAVESGFRVVYDREVPFEIRYTSGDGSDTTGALEAVRVKVLTMASGDVAAGVRIELTSENDIFFHYTHDMEQSAFGTIQEQQRLMVEFSEYHNIVIRMLEHCITDAHSFLAVLVIEEGNVARLDFVQNMEYKFVELLSCTFVRAPEDVVREQVQFRYRLQKARNSSLQNRLDELVSIVRTKNPSLLLQLQQRGLGGAKSANRGPR